MWCPGAVFVGFAVADELSSRRGERCAVETERSSELCIGGKRWVHSGGAQEIDGDFCLVE